jgi:hypothetical protein
MSKKDAKIVNVNAEMSSFSASKRYEQIICIIVQEI